MEIFSQDYILLNIDVASQKAGLKQIAAFAKQKGIITKVNQVYQALLTREQESTTGFKDGFAIPHARTSAISKPAIIFTSFKKGVDWNALDNKPVKYCFVILIPTVASDIHIDLLAKVSTALLDQEFIEKIQSSKDQGQIFQLVNHFLTQDKGQTQGLNNNNLSNKKIVGVTACATGVVHTYMAKEALEKVGTKLGHQVRIETQGQKGQEFILTPQEIKSADLVIIAADINIDLERFNNKHLIKIKTNDVINNPEAVINHGLKNAPIYQTDHPSVVKVQTLDNNPTKFAIFMQHMLSGVSRMIPFIVFSGILWAIINSVAIADVQIKKNYIFNTAIKVAEVGFTFFIAIMGAFIADSIAGRAALAPGLMATYVAANSGYYFWWGENGHGIPHAYAKTPWNGFTNNVSLSLFAALMMGFAAGYLVKWVNSWKVPKTLAPMMPILFIPIVCTATLVFPFVFLLSGPLGFLMNGFAYGLKKLGEIQGVNFLIGFILGAMIGFDMGGPINKIAGTTATSLIAIDPRLMGAVATAIPIAPLGCGLATVCFRKFFDDHERSLGTTALALGFFGISEGAIPFAAKRPKETLIANVVGSAVAGGCAFLFYVGGFVGMWGGPITAFVFGVHSPLNNTNTNWNIPVIFGGEGGLQFLAIFWFFVAIAIGSLVHIIIYMILIFRMPGFSRGSHQSGILTLLGFDKYRYRRKWCKKNYQFNLFMHQYWINVIKLNPLLMRIKYFQAY